MVVQSQPHINITEQDPHSIPAQAMIAALWDEIQRRYNLTGECDINPDDFTGARALFLVAFANDVAVGSVGLKPLSEEVVELNAMYVAPEFRLRGVAQSLIQELETHAHRHRFHAIRLRAGKEQPEALRFYEKMGFVSIPCFGEYTSSKVSLCFEKQL